MADIPDRELLAEFARSESETSFAELMRRHIALVHSVARRHTDNPQHAQEITQAVFIILARKAATRWCCGILRIRVCKRWARRWVRRNARHRSGCPVVWKSSGNFSSSAA